MPRTKKGRTRPGVKLPPTSPANIIRRGRGRPRKTTSTLGAPTTLKDASINTASTKTVTKDDIRPREEMDIDSQAVRWKVVKMAWKFSSDTEVARLLLDCYDVIVSGCLKWSIDIQKTRIPSVVSDDGWNLLEEILSVMKWKASQPVKKRLLTELPEGGGNREDIQIKQEALDSYDNDDDDDYDEDDDYQGMEDDDNDEDYVPEGMVVNESVKEPVKEENNKEDGEDEDVAKLQPLTQNTDSSPQSQVSMNLRPNKKSKARTNTKVAPAGENAGPKTRNKRPQGAANAGPKAKKKKSQNVSPKGYRKSGRPKKILEFLNKPDLPKIFECKRCGDRQKTLEGFKDHFKVHSQTVAIGNTVQQLSHMSIEAIPEIAIVHIRCPDCNELTANYGLHQLKHFKEMCYLCGKVFKSFSGWRRHLKFEKAMETGERNHICDKCGKGFILVSALTEHRRLHSKERPHTCDVCGKGFKQKAHLTRHLFIHSDVKPITCKYCGKGFTNNFNLKSHLRSHTGERPFTCQTCGKSFAHNGSLRAHMKSEHDVQVGLVCQTVQEFEDFMVPKKTPGRKKSTTEGFGGSKRLLPEETPPNQRLQPEGPDDNKISLPERPGDDKRLLPEETAEHKISLPERTANDNRSVPEGTGDNERALPEQNTQASTPTPNAKERQVHEAFMTLAESIETCEPCMEDAETVTNEQQQQQVLKVLENDNFRKEEANSILSLAAASSGINMSLPDENPANSSSEMLKPVLQQNSEIPPTSYQETYTSLTQPERMMSRGVDVQSHPLSTESAVWPGASLHSASQNITDSKKVVTSPNVLVQSVSSASHQPHKVEASQANSGTAFGGVETQVPIVSREEEVGGIMSRLQGDPRLEIHGHNRPLTTTQSDQLINIQVPRVTAAGQSFDSVAITIPHLPAEQGNQEHYL